jgi:hypothetical protein
MMSKKICINLGLLSGAAVGALMSLLHGYTSCCGAPVYPATFWRLAMDGMVVALITMFFAALFTHLVTHLPLSAVFLLAFYIAIVTGFLLGPAAYHIHNAGLALLVCAYVGAFLSWLICRVVCGKGANTLVPAGVQG